MNEIEKPKSKGKNIRVSDKAFNAIRKYCFKHNLRMGNFVEMATSEIIKPKKNFTN